MKSSNEKYMNPETGASEEGLNIKVENDVSPAFIAGKNIYTLHTQRFDNYSAWCAFAKNKYLIVKPIDYLPEGLDLGQCVLYRFAELTKEDYEAYPKFEDTFINPELQGKGYNTNEIR